jgi:hypothetical protein
MAIFSMDGTLIRTLLGKNTAGHHVIVWEGMDNYGHYVSPGVYFLRLTTGNILNRKLILIR